MLTIRWTLDQEGRLVMTFVRLNKPYPRLAYAEVRQVIQKNALAQNGSTPDGVTTNDRLTTQTPDSDSDRSYQHHLITKCNSQVITAGGAGE
ncbi:MAG: hypothetical protein J7467_00120 [Chloroflexus sp.]|jgi:hypothetical protein|nr:hypothetical protein [Chloroflexus sp.]